MDNEYFLDKLIKEWENYQIILYWFYIIFKMLEKKIHLKVASQEYDKPFVCWGLRRLREKVFTENIE